MRIFLQQLGRRQHDARRAEPALEGIVLEKRLLQRRQSAAWLKPSTVVISWPSAFDGEDQAAAHRFAVEQHRAGAAVAAFAADLRALDAQLSRRTSSRISLGSTSRRRVSPFSFKVIRFFMAVLLDQSSSSRSPARCRRAARPRPGARVRASPAHVQPVFLGRPDVGDGRNLRGDQRIGLADQLVRQRLAVQQRFDLARPRIGRAPPSRRRRGSGCRPAPAR